MAMTEHRSKLKEIEFAVVGGMCRLRFTPGISTGRGDDTRPGVAFDLIAETPKMIPSRDGRWGAGMGVIGRSDAKRLADAIYEFLREHPV